MSPVRKPVDKPIAIFCSDIHLSLTPPAYRMNEPDWFMTMQKPLDELQKLAEKWNVPIFCAGDIFDRWNSSPELINWALDYLPIMYCIPGQHDLPEHSIDQIERSAYQTMVKAGRIKSFQDLPYFHFHSGINIWPFPYGTTVKSCPIKEGCNIALIHEYNWRPGHSYFDESLMQISSIDKTTSKFKGYNFVFCGDNHIPFTYQFGKTLFVNCGALMRRHSNDSKIAPSVWGLFEFSWYTPTYSAIRHLLNTNDEIYVDTSEKDAFVEDSTIPQLIDNLKRMKKNTVVFEDALKLYVKSTNVSSKVKEEIIKAMEE